MTVVVTKSNAVAQAIEETLEAHLNEFMTVPATLQYHQQSGVLEMKASMAPAIWIDDKGDNQEDGYPPEYAVPSEYSFDLEIWNKYAKSDDARYGLNTWRDCVKACLNKYWYLNDPVGAELRNMHCDATDGDPAMEGPGVGSDVLWMCTVRCKVMVMSVAGSATL